MTNDGLNNGFYVKQGGALVKKSSATLSSVSSLIGNGPGQGRAVIIDESGNILIEVTPALVNHPDVNSIRTQAAVALAASSAIGKGAAKAGFAVVDESGNILLNVTSTTFEHPVISALIAAVAATAPATAAVQSATGAGSAVICDAAGNYLLEVTQANINHPDTNAMRSDIANLKASTSPTDWTVISALAQFLHFIFYGQSLSVGQGGVPVKTTALPSFAKKFVGGVRPWDGGTDPSVIYASLQPYAETVSGTMGETFGGGQLAMISQLLLAEDGVDLSLANILLGSSTGFGGVGIAALSKGASTGYFSRTVDTMTYAKARATDLGMLFASAGVSYVQGESDRNALQATYMTQQRQLRADFEAAAQLNAGNTKPFPMMTYQTPSHLFYGVATAQIAQAQLELATSATDPYIAMASPIYFMPANLSDLPHLTALGYRWMGAYFGLGWKRWLWDGIKPIPLAPKSVVVDGSTVYFTFPIEKGKRLLIDTAGFANPGNYGMSAVDSAGANVVINSVSLMGGGRVRVVCAVLPKYVRYGWIGNAYFGGGCLRDNTGDSLVFDPTGDNLPLHRWVPIFQKQVS